LSKQLSDIDQTIRYIKTAWTVHVIPLIEISAGIVKDLNAMIFTVSYIHLAFAIGAYAMGKIELTGTTAIITPGAEKLPTRGEFVNASVTVPIGNIEISTLRGYCNFSRSIERGATLGYSPMVASTNLI
jgi:hypothetical protein